MGKKMKGTRKRKMYFFSASDRLELENGFVRSGPQMKKAEMWQTGTLCDIEIIVENETFPAHRNVLAAGSGYMHALLCENRFKDSTTEMIKLHDMASGSFRHVLEWLYEGRCEVVESELTDLLEASSRLQCLDLFGKLEEVISDRLEASNCINTLIVAEKMQLPTLARAAETKALECYRELIDIPDFNMLPAARPSTLIGNDKLEVEKEEDVFDSGHSR